MEYIAATKVAVLGDSRRDAALAERGADVAAIQELSAAEPEEVAGGIFAHVAVAATTYAWYKWQKANGGPNWGV